MSSTIYAERLEESNKRALSNAVAFGRELIPRLDNEFVQRVFASGLLARTTARDYSGGTDTTISYEVGAQEGTWYTELATISTTDASFDRMEMPGAGRTPPKVVGAAALSAEYAQDGLTTDQLEDMMALRLIRALHVACVAGAGIASNQPLGVATAAGVPAVTGGITAANLRALYAAVDEMHQFARGSAWVCAPADLPGVLEAGGGGINISDAGEVRLWGSQLHPVKGCPVGTVIFGDWSRYFWRRDPLASVAFDTESRALEGLTQMAVWMRAYGSPIVDPVYPAFAKITTP